MSSPLEIDADDPLRALKARLLRQLLGGGGKAHDWRRAPMAACLQAARTLVLRQAEVGDGSDEAVSKLLVATAVSARNEAAALALLYAAERDVCGDDGDAAAGARREELEALAAGYCERLGVASAAEDANLVCERYEAGTPEAALHDWLLEQGGSSAVAPARWRSTDGSTTLRGLAAPPGGLRGGALALEVPQRCLITYATARSSDFGAALAALGLGDEALAVVWTMVERHDLESPCAPFWAALPRRFDTALSVPRAWLAPLEGTPAGARAAQARAHVQAQLAALAPVFEALLKAYAQHLEADWFSEQAYLWAVELWYAYAIQVRFPNDDDTTTRPALAPYASLANHSATAPHVVRFSTVDAARHALPLRTLRPLRGGEQLALSYGTLDNESLLLFYGFCLPPAESVHDTLEVALVAGGGGGGGGDATAAATAAVVRARVLKRQGLPLKHVLRRRRRHCCESNTTQQQQLMAAARVMAATPGAELDALAREGRTLGGDGDGERAARALLAGALASARAPFEAGLRRLGEDAGGGGGGDGENSAAAAAAFARHVDAYLRAMLLLLDEYT